MLPPALSGNVVVAPVAKVAPDEVSGAWRLEMELFG